MITRIYDLEVINSYLMQPDILPEFFIAEQKHVNNLNLYFLLGKWGLFPCVRTGSNMDCHAAIPYQFRGKQALEDARNVILWVFEKTHCTKVITKAKKEAKNRQMFNAMILNRVSSDDAWVYYEVSKWAA